MRLILVPNFKQELNKVGNVKSLYKNDVFNEEIQTKSHDRFKSLVKNLKLHQYGRGRVGEMGSLHGLVHLRKPKKIIQILELIQLSP